jgi:choline-sulfatase
MTRHDIPQSREPDGATTLSRRQFLQSGLAAATTAALALPHNRSEATTAESNPRQGPPKPPRSKSPNILVILCDEMRFPPSYESEYLKQFRGAHLNFQNALLANGLNFQRHYIMSSACVPSRASILTGQYPSLHGVSQTYAGAKEASDPDVFWLDPNTVPTFGNYFRAAGYLTFWIGKWHVSNADMVVPGTHEPVLSFDPTTGARDPAKERLYQAANRLDPYGFAGWIGPESHGSDAVKDTGSSVPGDKRGRDISFAEQAAELLQELDRHPNAAPWLLVCSFVNPHDISCDGMFTQPIPGHDTGFQFNIDESLDPPIPQVIIPNPEKPDDHYLFDSSFQASIEDSLTTKPRAQTSYRNTYHVWMNPVLEPVPYSRYYYQLHKNVDSEMMAVFSVLQSSRYKDDTIVVFTSDHGEMLLAHGLMHQKMYQAYEETTHVPLMIWYPKAITGPRTIDALTSHADLAPTLLGLAGIAPEQISQIRQMLAVNHSDAAPFVGRDLSSLILGQGDFASVNDPVYYMTDDDPTRGLHMTRRIGLGYTPVEQPAHIETVIARLDDGHVWKFSRYFDNPQYWSNPGLPGVDSGAEDVLRVQVEPDPPPDVVPQPVSVVFGVWAKGTPVPNEFEMYDLTADPAEIVNRFGAAEYASQQEKLVQILVEQRQQKSLTPCSGDVPGQICNRSPVCEQACGG